MKKLLSIFALCLLFVTSAFAIERPIKCQMEDDEWGALDFYIKIEQTSAKVLLVVGTEDGNMKTPLPAEVSRKRSYTYLDVGFFMGSLRFYLPNDLSSKETKVKVVGSSEGSVSTFQASCRTSK